jgi:Heparinase II/III-like protein/Heparinase II/III N-terminus
MSGTSEDLAERVNVGLGWRLRRLAAMGTSEILFRVGRAAQAHLERMGLGLARPPEPSAGAGRPWVSEISRQFAATEYLAAADRILSGRFDLFAMRPAELGFPPRWNRDPRTGIEAPLRFGKTLNYRDSTQVGEIKYLWELNRHLELVTLAQAWHISRQPHYAQACCELLQSWFDQCPYPLGVNWTSSLEHGIRLVNWAVAWHLLQTSPICSEPERQEFLDRWRACVYQHCFFIKGHQSRYSSANNHLLGELGGLLVASLTWPCWPQSARWATLAHQQFEAQCLLQTYPDGVNREQAVWYHHEVADMMLIVGLFARANGRDFSARYWQRLELMLDFIASIMDVAGNVPAFGDADDAVLVRFCTAQPANVYRSLLATGGLLFDRPELCAKAGHPDDKSRWLLGDEAMRRYAGASGPPGRLPVRTAFPHGGYYVLGDRFESKDEIRIVADAGPLGYLSIAAHGHADALSFTLSHGGNECLVDPGTYAYHSRPEWRKYFRGTSAHNTLRVDGEDQSVQTGPFLWGRRAAVVAVDYRSDDLEDRLSAAHDGYARLAAGTRVSRTIAYDRSSRVVTVGDELSSPCSRLIEIFWHFSEHCSVALSTDHAAVHCGAAILKLTWPGDLLAELVRGQEHPPLGWRSRSYDVRFPICTLRVFGNVSGHWRGTTTIATA